MIGTTAALLGSAAIGAGASIFSGNKADKQQAKNQKAALAQQEQQYQRSSAMMQPYISGGTDALSQYRGAVGLDGADKQKAFYQNFQSDPGFEEGLNRSLDDTMKKYSIYGDTGGGLAKDLVKTGQEARYGQYQQRLAQLGGLVDTGRTAASALSTVGQAGANASTSAIMNTAQPYGATGVMNAANSVIGGLNNNAMMNMWQQGMAKGGSPMMSPWNTQTVNSAGF